MPEYFDQDTHFFLEAFFRKSNESLVGFSTINLGANNQVYVLRTEKRRVVLKKYASNEFGLVRFNREVVFTELLNRHHLNVPKLIFYDRNLRLAVYEYIDGRRPEMVNEALISQASFFIKNVNDTFVRDDAKKIGYAADYCNSIRDHCDMVDQRLRKTINNYSVCDVWIRNSFDKVLTQTQELYRKFNDHLRVSGLIDLSVPASSLILSPSDFGFHNSIVNKAGEIFFIDFEYAGWDDPAKLLVDIFYQPDIQIENKYWTFFESSIANNIENDSDFIQRCNVLKLVLGIKWLTIIMNVLSPDILNARVVLLDKSKEQVLNHYLDNAVKLIARIETNAAN